MIQRAHWENSEEVIATLKAVLPAEVRSLLVLGAGELGTERQVFDLDAMDKIVAVEWGDGQLSELNKRKNTVAMKLDLSHTDWDKGFINDSFDVVTMFDVIEHLPYASAKWLLEDALLLAKKESVAFVPVQSVLLNDHLADDWLQDKIEDKTLPQHLSLWTPELAESRGYSVIYDPDYHTRNTHIVGIEGAMICWRLK